MSELSEQTVQDEEEFLEWLRKQTGMFYSDLREDLGNPEFAEEFHRVRKVVGRVTATKCGVRCRTALSRHCSCSCGGALHGSFA